MNKLRSTRLLQAVADGGIRPFSPQTSKTSTDPAPFFPPLRMPSEITTFKRSKPFLKNKTQKCSLTQPTANLKMRGGGKVTNGDGNRCKKSDALHGIAGSSHFVKKSTEIYQKLQRSSRKSTNEAISGGGRVDSATKDAKSAHHKVTPALRNRKYAAVMIHRLWRTIQSIMREGSGNFERKKALQAVFRYTERHKEVQRPRLWAEAARDFSVEASKTPRGKKEVESVCKIVRVLVGSFTPGSSTLQPQQTCSSKAQDIATRSSSTLAKHLGRPKKYCPVGVNGEDSKYAVEGYEPKDIVACTSQIDEESERIYDGECEGIPAQGDMEDVVMTTAANVESTAGEVGNSDGDTADGREEISGHIEGVNMTDAPVTSHPPVAATQSSDFDSKPATPPASSPLPQPGSYQIYHIPPYASRWCLLPRFLAGDAAPAERKDRRRSQVPGLDDEDDDQVSAPTPSSEADQKMIDDLSDWLAGLRIFDEAPWKDANAGVQDLPSLMRKTSGYAEPLLKANDAQPKLPSLTRKASGNSGPVLKVSDDQSKLPNLTSKTSGNSGPLLIANDNQPKLPSLKSKTSSDQPKLPSLNRKTSSDQPKLPSLKRKTSSDFPALLEMKRRCMKHPTENQDDDSGNDKPATDTKLESPKKVLGEFTMSTASPVVAPQGSAFHNTLSINNSHQNDAMVDVAPTADLQPETPASLASSIVSPPNVVVFSATDGSVVPIDGRAVCMALRLKTSSKVEIARPSPMGPPALPISAMKRNRIISIKPSSSSSSTINRGIDFFNLKNMMSCSQPLAAGYAYREARKQQLLLVLIHLVPEVFKADMRHVIEWPVCSFVPAVSNKTVPTIVDLVNEGPGAEVAPRVLAEKFCTGEQRSKLVGFFRGIREGSLKVWLAVIISYLQSGRTPEDMLGKDCDDILAGKWVVDLMRLDRLSRPQTALKSDEFFTRNDLPQTLRKQFDQARSKSMGLHSKVFEVIVKQWVKAPASKSNNDPTSQRNNDPTSKSNNDPTPKSNNDPTSKSNRELFVDCVRKAGWTEARSRYVDFIRWTLNSAPASLRDACTKSFRWAYPRFWRSVSTERKNQLGLDHV